MKRLTQVLFCALLVLTLAIPTVVHAQDDSDGDGVPDSTDKCPSEKGPKENEGCPWPDSDNDGLTDDVDQCPSEKGAVENNGCPLVEQPQAQPQPDDRDGDGVNDAGDSCPDQAGTAANSGCPAANNNPPAADSAPPTTDNSPNPAPLPVLANTGPCLVATQGHQGVNIREYAQADAAIVGTLDPYQSYPVIAQSETDSDVWYFVGTGWVSGTVVRLGGTCGNMIALTFGPSQDNLGPLQTIVLPASTRAREDFPSSEFCDDSVRAALLINGEITPTTSDDVAQEFHVPGHSLCGLSLSDNVAWLTLDENGHVAWPEVGQPTPMLLSVAPQDDGWEIRGFGSGGSGGEVTDDNSVVALQCNQRDAAMSEDTFIEAWEYLGMFNIFFPYEAEPDDAPRFPLIVDYEMMEASGVFNPYEGGALISVVGRSEDDAGLIVVIGRPRQNTFEAPLTVCTVGRESGNICLVMPFTRTAISGT